MPSLLPYSGDRREHLGPDGQGGHELSIYGADRTGKVRYRFNALGFRGDEPRDGAALRIFASGCSYTFGVALHHADTWVEHLRRGLAERLALPVEAVELANFAQGGASNDYVARTLLTQVGRIRPDLVVALFTHSERAELLLEDGYKTLGPWALRYLEESPENLPPAEREYVQLALDFYRTFTPIGGVARSLQSILLVQSFLAARGIPYAFAWVDHPRLRDPQTAEHPAIAPLIALLDRERWCKSSPMDPAFLLDRAEDGIHPGPKTNARFAAEMIDRFFLGNPAFEAGPR